MLRKGTRRSVRHRYDGFLSLKLAFCCCVLWAAPACGGEEGCDFEAETREFAGLGLTDCGVAHEGEASDVDRCAVQARESGLTFRALYEQPDDTIEALLRNPHGDYAVLKVSADGDTIERAECEGSSIAQDDGRTYVACAGRSEFTTICQ